MQSGKLKVFHSRMSQQYTMTSKTFRTWSGNHLRIMMCVRQTRSLTLATMRIMVIRWRIYWKVARISQFFSIYRTRGSKENSTHIFCKTRIDIARLSVFKNMTISNTQRAFILIPKVSIRSLFYSWVLFMTI